MGSVSFNSSALNALANAIAGADNKSLQAGWFDSAKYDDGTPVAGIAAQNEYGNPGRSIPPRPFIRPAVENNSEEWAQIAERGAAAMIEGRATFDQVLNALGLKVTANIKREISGGNHAALSPITIALRKIRNDDKLKIGGKLVGQVAGAIASGETGAGQLGDQSFGNKDPLRDSGYMIATLTHEVS